MEVPSPRESAPTYVVKFKGIRASRPWQPSRGLELAPGVFSSGAVSMPLCIPLLPCGAPPQLSSTRGAGSIPEGHVVTTVPCSPRKLTLRDPPGLRVHRPPPPPAVRRRLHTASREAGGTPQKGDLSGRDLGARTSLRRCLFHILPATGENTQQQGKSVFPTSGGVLRM